MADETQSGVAEAAPEPIETPQVAEATEGLAVIDDSPAAPAPGETPFGTMTDAELDALLAGTSTEEPAAAEGEAEAETDGEGESETPEEDGEDSAEAEESKNFDGVKRINVKNLKPEDRNRVVQLNDLMRGGMNFDEAVAFLGKGKAAAEAKQTEAAPEPQAEKTPIQEAEARKIAALTKIKEARSNFDSEAESAAMEEYSEALTELGAAKALAKLDARESEKTMREAFAKAKASIVSVSKDYADEASPLGQAYRDLVDSAKPEQLTPEGLSRLARMAWAAVHDTPFPTATAKAGAAPTPARKPAVPVASSVLNAGTTRTGGKGTIQLRDASDAANLSDAELETVLAGASKRRF